MNREQQVEYCKRCTKQMFDANQGLLCSLTHQKADFETECIDFVVDESKVKLIQKKQESVKKGRIAFGMIPNKSMNFSVSDLSQNQLFVVAHQAAKVLKWNIGTTSESGFFAYTVTSLASWGEQVEVKIGVGNITVKSECNSSQVIDWGKNMRNIERFISAFNKLKILVDTIDVDEKYEQLSQNFKEPVINLNNETISTERSGKLTGFFSVFNPTNGYFITPILVLTNVLLFIAMIISGVHFLMPTADSIILWGGNVRPLTIDGQWWRLITNTFLHFGIFHLLFNMYALIYIGLLLEPYLGKVRFLSAYLLAGIAASATSTYWHEFTVSAGASGAIFGLYGIFLALLTTNFIEKAARRSLLVSIGLFVMYNLLNGFKDSGIDNAAHLGGLISGLIIGYSFYPGLIKNNLKSKAISIGALTLLIGLVSFSIMNTPKSDFTKYQKDMQQIMTLEQSALRTDDTPDLLTDQQMVEDLQNNGITQWRECIRLLDKMNTYNLPEGYKMRIKTMKTYFELRIKTNELIIISIKEQTQKYEQEIYGYLQQSEKIANEIRGETQK